MQTLLVKTGYGEITLKNHDTSQAQVFENLFQQQNLSANDFIHKIFSFYVILGISLIVISLTFPACIFIDRKFRQKIILSWVAFFRWWIRICCGVKIVFEGNVEVINLQEKNLFPTIKVL